MMYNSACTDNFLIRVELSEGEAMKEKELIVDNEPTETEIQAAFALVGKLLGSKKTARKALSSKENGKKGGRPALPLEQIACICKETDNKHLSTCPRGRAIRRRAIFKDPNEAYGND